MMPPLVLDMLRKGLIIPVEIPGLMQAQVLLVSGVILVGLTLSLMIRDRFHVQAGYPAMFRRKT